jgi:hypothetical protein
MQITFCLNNIQLLICDCCIKGDNKVCYVYTRGLKHNGTRPKRIILKFAPGCTSLCNKQFVFCLKLNAP